MGLPEDDCAKAAEAAKQQKSETRRHFVGLHILYQCRRAGLYPNAAKRTA